MEQELQMPSCLFGGPPVRDDLIKLGESQIGFMNIFARPLFEAVADILPAMRYAVEEILTNNSIWEKKIGDEKDRRKKRHPKFSLGHLAPSFSVDPTPSPLSDGPQEIKLANPPALPPPSQLGPPVANSDENSRRVSGGSLQGALPNSRRSSSVIDKESHRSSGAGLAGVRSWENQSQSRRGSGDASITAILVTETSNVPDPPGREANDTPTGQPIPPSEVPPSLSGTRKDTMMKSSPKKDKDGARPVTAPSPSRRTQGKKSSTQDALFYISSQPLGVDPDFDSATNLFPAPHPSSQSHSEVDLSSHAMNGDLDGSKIQKWESNKASNDSNNSRSDGSRDSSRRSDWWRQLRRTRDHRNGGLELPTHRKDATLEPTLSNSNADAVSPVATSPGKTSKTGKLKSFFRRRSGKHNDQEKQLSSYGSSSQLRTPPISDPGRSVNSDE